jgi:hypothetical protein
MPREKDDERLALLRRILADPVVVIFRAKALSGGERRDEGASNLLPRHANEGERGLRTFVRIELLEFLRRGGQPNRVEGAATTCVAMRQCFTSSGWRLKGTTVHKG